MKPGVRSFLILIALVATLAVGAMFGWEWRLTGRFVEKTDNAFVHADITAISPKVGGYVSEVLIDDNKPVNAGDVMLRIEDSSFQADVSRAKAELSEKWAALTNLEQRRALQSTIIQEAEAAVRAAQANSDRRQKELKRAGALVNQGWASQRRHDEAVAEELGAEAEVARTVARLAAERQQLAVIDSERAEVEAEVARSEAELTLAQINLRYTVVHAPSSGIVGNLRVEQGEYVRPGARLAAVVPLHQVWIIANYKETQLTNMVPGQSVSVEVDTFPGVEVKGHVDSMAPASGAQFSLLPPDNATGNYTKVVQRIPVKIVLEPGHSLEGRLRPGMSVITRVDTRTDAQRERSARGLGGLATREASN
ncbi:MAG: multidrug transporter [Alphaproteobacteria bacterium]|nr:multidrug transporter [Alphaproteobacteria bacterium]|tara:strand:+ start:3404 stop:4501 length:1098 start_codon:yes stop_codon:yes gene_type:complete